MSRPWWSRALTAVLGLWLVLELGEPGILHLAAMSAGMPMTHGMAAMSDMAGMTHDMSASTAMEHGGDHAPGGGAPEPTKCPCVAGGCVSATVIALLDAMPATAFAESLVPTPAVERVPVSLLPRPGPRYSRPYTTGPPRV